MVIDIGTSSLRAGYAGDDTPKAIIPSSYGYIELPQEQQPSEQSGDGDVTMAEGDAATNGDAANKAEQPEQSSQKKVKLYIGQNGPSMWREGMEIGNPVVNGMSESIPHSSHMPRPLTVLSLLLVSNFDPIPPLIDHALKEVMRCDASEHPVLVTEPAWNTPANRERMAEIMFEEFHVPAFYISNTSVLNA